MTVDAHTLSPRRTALGLATVFGGLVVGAGVIIGAAAGVGAAWHATNPPGASPVAAAAASSGTSGKAPIKVLIENVKTPEGSEPAFVGPNGVGKPILFTADVGTATQVTFVNKTSVPHTFTSSALGIDVTIPPGPATVHVTVDPKHAGKASWECDVPCGAWVMAQSGYMLGNVEVIA